MIPTDPQILTKCMQTLCMLGYFSCFCFCVLKIFKINFFKKFFQVRTIRVSNGLDPDKDQHSVSLDLSPKFPGLGITENARFLTEFLSCRLNELSLWKLSMFGPNSKVLWLKPIHIYQ